MRTQPASVPARISVKSILRAVRNPYLSLYRGEGYWYFVLDDGGDLFEEQSVPVMRLNQLSFSEWVDEGRAFCNRVMGK